jgi:hypothetical protein
MPNSDLLQSQADARQGELNSSISPFNPQGLPIAPWTFNNSWPQNATIGNEGDRFHFDFSGPETGSPEIRPGVTIQLLGLGNAFDGDYLVNRVTHQDGFAGYSPNDEPGCDNVRLSNVDDFTSHFSLDPYVWFTFL